MFSQTALAQLWGRGAVFNTYTNYHWYSIYAYKSGFTLRKCKSVSVKKSLLLLNYRGQ